MFSVGTLPADYSRSLISPDAITCYRWEKTHALLIEGGLTYEAIRQSVADAKITFKDGVVKLFEFLEVWFSFAVADLG